jgi:hypothetical protein
MFYSISTSFSALLTNGSNKLQCFITLGWKGLPGTNNPTYYENSYITAAKSLTGLAPAQNKGSPDNPSI